MLVLTTLFGLSFGLLSILLLALKVVGLWMVFEKIGEPGWKALFPFYSDYILLSKVWDVQFYWIYLGLSIVGGIFSSLAGDESNFYSTLSSIAGIAGYLIYAYAMYMLGKSFRKENWFIIGLIFLTDIFCIILGFDNNSQYYGNTYDKTSPPPFFG